MAKPYFKMDPFNGGGSIFDGAQPSLTGIGFAKLAGSGLQVELELIVRVPD